MIPTIKFLKFLKFTLLIFISSLFINCSKDDETKTTASSEKNITSFVIPNIETSINQAENKITIFVPASTTSLYFGVTITLSNGARLNNYSLNTSIDFTTPVEFVVVALDGTSKKYTTQIVKQDGIKFFKLKVINPFFEDRFGVINIQNKTITVDVPKDLISGFQQSIRTIEFEITPGCTTNIVSGSVVDINNPQDLILAKSDGTIETYDVKIRNYENNLRVFVFPSTSFTTSAITLFAYPASNYPLSLTVGLEPSDLIVRTLITEDVSNVIPKSISVSINSTVSPNPTNPQNFNQDVVYTLTSEAGQARNIKVRVLKEKIIFSASANQLNGVTAGGGAFFYYVGISKITGIKFIKENTSEEITGSIFQNYIHNNTSNNTDEYYLNYGVPTTTLPGIYNLKVTLENGETLNTYYRISVS
ncbi:hypothetical protein [Flavobacterium sp.]|uniref:hypothetical protein n=1 Tax=Flavobacterium sp. TaxID=239 RepID=UPI00286CE911|nr:hypothetical protein [Flavobacterium sp.]